MVSGFNVGLVYFIIFIVLKMFGLKGMLRFLAACVLLILYCFVTGASTPVVRATIMAITFMFSYFIRRQADIYNSSAAAALCILLFAPGEIFNVGFQLSFLSVLAIAYFYPRLVSALRVKDLKNRPLKYVLESILISFSAWLGTLGVIAYNFRIISPVTVLANLAIVPLASLLTLSGFGLLFIQTVSPGFAGYAAKTCELITTLIFLLSRSFLKIPWASFKF